jgi:probable H4MPT-linked C1 transfer pathway protein
MEQENGRMPVLGWDLGGANVKLAVLEEGVNGGCVTEVVQIPCPVIPERCKFDQAVEAALPRLSSPALHAVTMTGELSDVFGDRAEGVGYLVALMQRIAGGDPLRIYAGHAGFLAPDAVQSRTMEVASANWHATAALLAHHSPHALLIDVGTTTTDLIPIKDGAVAARGSTDAERMTQGELLYSGVVRTPVMAVAKAAPFRGRLQGIAAERFATMADVFRLTGDLADDADPYPAADQRGKTAAESAARLARMLGRDGSEAELGEWTELARFFAGCQADALAEAARTLIARVALAPTAPVIGAGCGRFLAEALAGQLARPYLDFADIVATAPETRERAARCAPAVAVALLAAEKG